MLSYAVLIDAGFLKQKFRRIQSPITSDMVEAFVAGLRSQPFLKEHRLHRIYFYDAKPLVSEAKHPSGETIEFAKTATATQNQALHSGLEKSPYVALRFGELVHQGWRISKHALRKAKPETTFTVGDLEPHVQQKGVDMRIGLDIASLTLKKQASIIVLVTGDSDFIPAMKFARREGAQLVLVTLGHGVEEVYQHADIVITDDAQSYFQGPVSDA